MDSTKSLREIAVEELEKASLERIYQLQEGSAPAVFAPSRNEIGALIYSFVGWLANASREAILHPLEFSLNLITTVASFLIFLYSTGILKEFVTTLFMMCMDPSIVDLTAWIQASFANSRRADCAIQETITEENKRKLLKASERYFKFSTAAYGIPQMWASEVQRAPTFQRAKGITHPIEEMIAQKVANETAKFLGISPEQILFLTPPLYRPLRDSSHFVAVDHQTSSVVVAIRGTYSISELCSDANAETGT